MMLLFVVILAACNDSNDQDDVTEERIVPVEVTEVKVDDLIAERAIYGRIQPKDLTPVMSPLPGEITDLEVENGDIVEEDDLIAKVMTQAGVRNIYAPASGEIIELSGKEGSLLPETDPLALILNLDELKISFSVTSAVRDLFVDKEDFTAVIENDSYDIDITSINKMPNDTGLYPVEATVKNKDEKLLPGMVAVVFLPQNVVKQATVLPTEAIIVESEGAYVYKVHNDQVTKVDVTIIETQTDMTAIEGEIEEGDQIVINGQLTLSDGSKVVITEEGNES